MYVGIEQICVWGVNLVVARFCSTFVNLEQFAPGSNLKIDVEQVPPGR